MMGSRIFQDQRIFCDQNKYIGNDRAQEYHDTMMGNNSVNERDS